MRSLICAEDYVAYRQCPRKAFLLLSNQSIGQPHEYVQAISAAAKKNAASYFSAITVSITEAGGTVARDVRSQADIVVQPTLRSQDLEASPDALITARQPKQRTPNIQYEPVFCVGTYRIEREHRDKLHFVSYLLKQVQKKPPVRGLIVTVDGKHHSVRLTAAHASMESVVAILRNWTLSCAETTEPRVILNAHCPYCMFRIDCEQTAREADDLTLLDRITPRLLQRYHKKGIFTVNQLSYLFRPRRSRKRSREKVVTFNVELQALAIRTGKIYLQHVPQIERSDTELFLDIEGVPDRGQYYLFGILVCCGQTREYHSFWANNTDLLP
jgi:predicted RecB family nuclease